MKRLVYIVAFGLFGLLVATLVHAVVEHIALRVIFENPERFARTVWWQNWREIHGTVSTVLWLAGLMMGLYLGIRWWEPHGSKPGLYHWRNRT